MKKIKILALISIMAMAFAGCGDNNESENTSTESSVESETTSQEISEETVEIEQTEETTATESVQSAEITKREILKGGEVNDNCLELTDVFIDFSVYDNASLGLSVEKRSETNVVITVDKGTEYEKNIQYSRSAERVGQTKYMDTTFPDGYEYVADPQYGDLYYSITVEETGRRVVILQDVGDECYVSIRTFDKHSYDPLLVVDEIMIKNLPIYYYE